MNVLRHMLRIDKYLIMSCNAHFVFRKIHVTTVHPWCSGHSTSINVCAIWSHTYILRLG